jgi:hypothetical protein
VGSKFNIHSPTYNQNGNVGGKAKLMKNYPSLNCNGKNQHSAPGKEEMR